MLFENDIKLFPASFDEILQRIDLLDPVKYGSTRNYINGAVSYLSPYISRGVISTGFVLNRLTERGYRLERIEKFIQELAWRDYWQQIWKVKGEAINTDLKHKQNPIVNYHISKGIIDGATGIEGVDTGIRALYKSGYVHNHVRMYIASVTCNIGQSHWLVPAKWMYYHLLDGDWASNALSWQWVAGTNSHKKYFANQENINKYCFTDQKNTFLDLPYESFDQLNVPEVLTHTAELSLSTPLPGKEDVLIDDQFPTCIYNYYNLDPLWMQDEKMNRILLLEPSHFRKYPVSENCIDFVLKLCRNIHGIQIFVGEFKELQEVFGLKQIYFKEHPLNEHYKGIEQQRDWMCSIEGYYPSFFAFWKKCKKELVPVKFNS